MPRPSGHKAIRAQRSSDVKRISTLLRHANASKLSYPPDIILEALQDEKHLRFLAESLPQIVWSSWPDGSVDYMNHHWFEYTGLTPEETYAETKTAVHPDDFDLYMRRWKQSLRTGEPYEMEYRFRRASDGMYRWHLGRALPLRDNEGRIVKWFGTCTDIHDQKEAEEEVRKLNEQLEEKVLERTEDLRHEVQERMKAEERVRANLELMQSMIDTMPMAAVATDKAFLVLHANEQFSQLFAVSDKPYSSALVGKNCLQLLKNAKGMLSSQADYREITSLLASDTVAFQKEVALKDGRTFSFHYIPIHRGAQMDGCLLLFRDISQEKRVDRAKSEFMSLASHQLRTPLTAIRWALGRLSRKLADRIDDQDRNVLERAHSSAVAMGGTITTMLAISRIESGTLALKASSVSLCSFLHELCADFADLCHQKNLKLSVSCSQKFLLTTDSHMLGEIIKNLLSNAVKYTPSGGRITVKAYREKGANVISVSDTGYGIPPHQQKKIFTKFFRADNIVHIDTEGTGLGLYLISQLIGILGGKISFTSELNKGTAFILSLPIYKDIKK